jgi:hypothetical protein
MHNQQRHLKTNNIISKYAVIVLSIVLLTGLALVPALQIGVNGQLQQQQPQQQNQVGLSQVIKQIAQQVVTANPGTTANHVQQVLVQLAKQIAQTSDQSTGIQVIKQIESQVSSFPKGRVSQAIIQIAKQQAAGNTILVTQVMQQAAQQIRTGVPGANALVQVALQAAAGGTPVINQQLNQIAQQVANGTGAQQTQILQTLQEISLQISNTEGGGGKDKVQNTVKVIHEHVSKNRKGPTAKSLIVLGDCFQAKGICKPTIIGDNNVIGDNNNVIGSIYGIGPQIVQTGDPINILGNTGAQVAVGSPGAVQQMNEITEQVSLETGGDPAQVKGVIQNLALTDSIGGGNTQELITDIATEVTKPNDQVSKSLTSLAMQEEKGNYEAVNTAVEKVSEVGDGGNNVEQLVAAGATTEGVAGATTEGVAGATTEGVAGATTEGVAGATTEGVAGAAAPLDEGTTEDDGEITGEELALEEEDDDSDSEDEGATADEEAVASDESEDDGDDDGDDGDDGEE